MTYEEILEDMCFDCVSYPCNTLKKNDHCSSYNKLNELITKSEEYRWHDLKKNPNDLPPLYEDVEVFDGKSYYIFSRCETGNNNSWDWEDSFGFYVERDEVIAWRKIKPYEGIEE